MIRALHGRFERARRDDGVTLIEALVVMLLSSLLMTIAGTFFVTVSMQSMKSEDVRLSTADASNIMNVVSTTIRAAVRNPISTSPNPDPAIVEGTKTSLTVITYTDAGPSFELPQRIRYRVDSNGRMVEERWYATDSGGYAVFPAITATPDDKRFLGNVVVNTSAEPLFRYFSSTNSPLGTAGSLSATDRAAVTSIRFYVKVRADTSESVVVLDNTVGMPNMNLGLTE